MKARRVLYEGKVQGVGFRYSVKQIAEGFDLCGTVRNLDDGRVELLVQGEELEIRDMLEAVFSSHLKGFIKKIESYELEVDRALKGFRILH